MSEPVDLYDSHYSKVEADVYRAVRAATYGEDLGQASWLTAAECDRLCGWLGLEAGRSALEVACGSGGVSVRMAKASGVSVTGVDINDAAVAAATERARAAGMQERARFRIADAGAPLPFPDASFDAIFCNDSINHFPDRARVLADWHRVLRPGGRCLYTDPIVVTGILTNAEIAARSSIGFFLFTPLGVNEELIRRAGFRLARVEDVTEAVAQISSRWRAAREARREPLCRLEGEAKFEDLQEFFAAVHVLASERRLSRFAYLAEKAEGAA